MLSRFFKKDREYVTTPLSKKFLDEGLNVDNNLYITTARIKLSLEEILNINRGLRKSGSFSILAPAPNAKLYKSGRTDVGIFGHVHYKDTYGKLSARDAINSLFRRYSSKL